MEGNNPEPPQKDILLLTVSVLSSKFDKRSAEKGKKKKKGFLPTAVTTSPQEEIPLNPGGGNYNNKAASTKTTGIISETSVTNFTQFLVSLHPTCTRFTLNESPTVTAVTCTQESASVNSAYFAWLLWVQ